QYKVFDEIIIFDMTFDDDPVIFTECPEYRFIILIISRKHFRTDRVTVIRNFYIQYLPAGAEYFDILIEYDAFNFYIVFFIEYIAERSCTVKCHMLADLFFNMFFSIVLLLFHLFLMADEVLYKLGPLLLKTDFQIVSLFLIQIRIDDKFDIPDRHAEIMVCRFHVAVDVLIEMCSCNFILNAEDQHAVPVFLFTVEQLESDIIVNIQI